MSIVHWLTQAYGRGRYADFKSCHQFARVNNLSLEYEEDEDTGCETLDEYIAENGEEIGFPKY